MYPRDPGALATASPSPIRPRRVIGSTTCSCSATTWSRDMVRDPHRSSGPGAAHPSRSREETRGRRRWPRVHVTISAPEGGGRAASSGAAIPPLPVRRERGRDGRRVHRPLRRHRLRDPVEPRARTLPDGPSGDGSRPRHDQEDVRAPHHRRGAARTHAPPGPSPSRTARVGGAAAAAAQRRSAAVAGGVLLLLGGSAALVIVSARRERRLAGRSSSSWPR